MRTCFLVAMAAALVIVVGCGGVQRVPATEEAVKVVDFNPKDLQLIAEKMVKSLLASDAVVESTERPICYVYRVGNRTSEHIDTKAVTDKIRTQLIKSRKFRFVDPTVNKEVLRELERQSSELIDQTTAVKFGRLLGARYFLYGDITSMTQRRGRKKGVYYKFTLNMLDIERGEIVWAEDMEIQKVEKRAWLGL